MMHYNNRLMRFIMGVFLFLYMVGSTALPVLAVTDFRAEAEARKSLPVETDGYENWPDGPAIGAESAILMEANTGTILYAKNIHEHLYPASTTKILTCLIASEKCKMDERVKMSTRPFSRFREIVPTSVLTKVKRSPLKNACMRSWSAAPMKLPMRSVNTSAAAWKILQI